MRPKILVSISLLLIAFNVSARAQSARIESVTREALEQIPLSGRTVEDFTPNAWKIETQSAGDLNSDGLPDKVISFVIDPENPQGREILKDPGGVFNYLPSPTIMTILFATKDGTFRRVASNSRLKPEFEFSTQFTMGIKNGVLAVNEDYSSSNDANRVAFRYRYDPTADKLMLIGFEFEYYTHDKSGNSVTTSENYLTGERVITVKESDRRKGGEFYYARTKTSRERFKPARVAFENSFLNREGGYIEVHPF
jgi:hypothetical protein